MTGRNWGQHGHWPSTPSLPGARGTEHVDPGERKRDTLRKNKAFYWENIRLKHDFGHLEPMWHCENNVYPVSWHPVIKMGQEHFLAKYSWGVNESVPFSLNLLPNIPKHPQMLGRKAGNGRKARGIFLKNCPKRFFSPVQCHIKLHMPDQAGMGGGGGQEWEATIPASSPVPWPWTWSSQI